ncbi:thymidine kinase [Nocardioides yefusunii]|uniref:Thymidine kinase n=1 Tax=Nocardioides yefusunii TaxID=2500546 RepID=A0ABW1R3H1_9ACTN|nr:thymidine kinase [Nocardioides yefusunii]
MDLTVILGPMKSGKSLELISLLSPLRHSNVTHAVYQSSRHGRDDGVVSRVGGVLETRKVNDLSSALDDDVEVVGVDEVHMFGADDVAVVAALLERGTRVVVAGLDLDHLGRLFEPVIGLLELGPAKVVHRRAVCDCCRRFNATHTQVLHHGEPYLADSTGALPDDGTYTYEARCRSCFVGPVRAPGPTPMG